MFYVDSEVGDVLIIRGVLFIPSKVHFPCLYFVNICVFGLKKLVTTALRIFLMLTELLFRTCHCIFFCTIIGACCVLRPCIPWPLASSEYSTQSAPFVQWKGGDKQTFCDMLYGHWHTQLLSDRFCLSTVLDTFYANKVLLRILEFSRPLTDQSSACVLH
jgi:hypothetical protein